MTRRRALSVLLFVLGAAHLLAAAAGAALVLRPPVPSDIPHDVRWLALLGATGLPPLVIALRRRHRALGRAALARTAAALLLLGAASAFAGQRITEAFGPLLGAAAWWPAMPGLAMALLGTMLMPLISVQPERRSGAREPPVVPRVGAAVTVYVLLDWVTLRLIAVALIAVAWILYDRIAAGAPIAPVAALLHGRPPEHAAVAYGAAGLILLFPVALPRALARPASLATGIVKGTMIAGLIWAVEPALPHLAVAFVPDHAAFAVSVAEPGLRAAGGVLIVASVVLAFFRQLGGGVLATEGRTAPPPDGARLRALRAARMDR